MYVKVHLSISSSDTSHDAPSLVVFTLWVGCLQLSGFLSFFERRAQRPMAHSGRTRACALRSTTTEVPMACSELVLQQEEVVGGRDGDDVLVGVPGGVQDLLVEVQAVHVDLVLLPFAPGAHL